jgi:hypothetical protein
VSLGKVGFGGSMQACYRGKDGYGILWGNIRSWSEVETSRVVVSSLQCKKR